MIDVVKALGKSCISYPAIAFWCWVSHPIIYFILSYGIAVATEGFIFDSLPLEYEFRKYTEYIHLIDISTYSQTIVLVQIYYFILRYFKRCSTHAAPRASTKFRYYQKLIIYPMILNIITIVANILIDAEGNPTIFLANYFILMLSEMVFIHIYNQVYIIEQGEIFPPGWGGDIIIVISYIIVFIALVCKLTFSSKNLITFLAPYFKILLCIFLSFKRIVITVGALGNRFIKLPEVL